MNLLIVIFSDLLFIVHTKGKQGNTLEAKSQTLDPRYDSRTQVLRRFSLLHPSPTLPLVQNTATTTKPTYNSSGPTGFTLSFLERYQHFPVPSSLKFVCFASIEEYVSALLSVDVDRVRGSVGLDAGAARVGARRTGVVSAAICECEIYFFCIFGSSLIFLWFVSFECLDEDSVVVPPPFCPASGLLGSKELNNKL